MLQAVWTLLIFPATLRFRLSFSSQAAGFALGYTASYLFCSLAQFWAFSMGKVATVALYMLIGGQAVPFVYALLFTKAQPTWLDVAGFVVLLLSCLPNVLGIRGEKTNEGKHGGKAIFLLLCMVTFFSNGFVNVFTDMNAKSPRGADSNTFLVLFALWVFLFVGILLAVLTARRMKAGSRFGAALVTGVGKNVGLRPFLVAFIIIGGYTVFSSVGNILNIWTAGTHGMQSSVQFPLLNAGIMVLTAILGRVVFKEKIKRRELCGILLAVAGILLFMVSFLAYGR